MNRKVLLAFIGLLVCLLMASLATDKMYAQGQTTAIAGDATATSQTSPAAALQEVPAPVPAAAAVTAPVTYQQIMPTRVTVSVQPRRVYIYAPPGIAVAPMPALRVMPYSRLYAMPVRKMLFRRYRLATAPAWYPLQQ